MCRCTSTTSPARPARRAIHVEGKLYEVNSGSRLNDICIEGTVNGEPFTAQMERGTAKNPLALRVQHNGTKIEALVMSPRMAELHRLMPFKAPPDMSRYVLSPMPGLLVDVPFNPARRFRQASGSP
jgi:propionyl-CoA carboxylase alpha chain